jgi:CSLREA domain-containing protein
MVAIRYALIFALLFLPASPFATTFPVTKTADTNDGSCDPDCSLREAIDAANANPGADDVPVPAGFYLLTLGQLTVSDDVSIAGVGRAITIVDGNASDRVFNIEAAAGVVEISGITVQNGNADSIGGGIRNFADLRLTNSAVSGNRASTHGGGIYAGSYAEVSITSSTISGNVALNHGGGISDDRYGYTTLTNSTVSGNTAGWSGGGIRGDYFSIANSTVSGNTAYDDGGGIDGSNFFIINSTLNGNTADYRGGGIWGGRFTLANSTVSGNTAYLVGGLLASSATITDSTVSRNTASSFGDGIYAMASTLSSTIVADNGETNCSNHIYGGFSSLGNNLSDDETCELTDPSDLVVADAMLGPLADNGGPTETHGLLPGSPAIDAGSMDCPPPDADQRGVERPQGAACDIGAVEYLPEPTGALMLIAAAGFLGLLHRRRARSLRIG